MLAEMNKAKGGKPYQSGNSTGSNLEPVERPMTLAEMGVSKKQSHEWQKLAAVPEQEFEEALTLTGHKPSARLPEVFTNPWPFLVGPQNSALTCVETPTTRIGRVTPYGVRKLAK